MRKTDRKAERGFSLIVSLLALMLLSAVAIGMMFMASTETAISSNFKSEEAAYFAARAGVEEARDRMRAGSANPITLPTALPPAANSVLYITQTGVGPTDIYTPGGKLSDDELCQDFPSAFNMNTVTRNVPCASTPSSGWMNTTASVAPYPLEYKWVRVTQKQNNSSPFPVDGTQSGGFLVCWNGVSEVATGPTCQGETLPVYLVTALAVTQSGARRLVQQEIALTETSSILPGGLFATSAACGALSLAGNAKTGSFNSATENPPTDPPSNLTLANGDIGANGTVSLGGSSTTVNGNVSSPNPGAIGNCGNAETQTGNPQVGTINGSAPPFLSPPPVPAPPYTPPTPPAPNPPPPTTAYPPAHTSIPDPLPPGSYGNMTIHGTVNLVGGTDINHPTIYTINSLDMRDGGATLNISGPVVINLAGGGNVNPVLNMTGGSFSNSTKIPDDLVINYGGTAAINLHGGAYPYAVINAPNAAVTFRGTNFYGQAIASTIDDQGGTNFYWDTSAKTTVTTTQPYFSEISLRELSY